jgi:transcriptional repressor NrdR
MKDGTVACPFCEHGFSRVLETRRRRRRRECVACRRRFTTVEQYVAHYGAGKDKSEPKQGERAT